MTCTPVDQWSDRKLYKMSTRTRIITVHIDICIHVKIEETFLLQNRSQKQENNYELCVFKYRFRKKKNTTHIFLSLLNRGFLPAPGNPDPDPGAVLDDDIRFICCLCCWNLGGGNCENPDEDVEWLGEVRPPNKLLAGDEDDDGWLLLEETAAPRVEVRLCNEPIPKNVNTVKIKFLRQW